MKMCLHRQLMLILLLCQYSIDAKGILFNSDIKLDLKTRQYNNIVVIVSNNNDQHKCKEILEDLQFTISEASKRIHWSLRGRGMIGSVTIQLPETWGTEDCGHQLSSSHYIGTGDVLVSVSGRLTAHQSAGECGARGDYIQLPASSFAGSGNISRSEGVGASQELGAAFLRLMYGVWTGVTPVNITDAGARDQSKQAARCWGQSSLEVITSHPDFSLASFSGQTVTPVNFSLPVFRLTRSAPPRYVIVLENSAMMGSQWDLVRTVAKNLILESEYLPASAQLGLVMFNSAAYTEHPLVPLSPTARQSLSLSIRSKHNLSPSTESCVSCGLAKAVETLHGAPGVVILISRGQSPASVSGEVGDSIWSLADKHQLRVFSVIIPPLGQVLPQLQLDNGGDSFFINSTGSFLSMYRECLHVTDTILRRTLDNYRAVIHEATYEPFVSGENNVEGRFIIDNYSGVNTTFKVYFTDIVESYIKGISVRSEEGESFNTIVDNKISLHYYSLYEVPFDLQSSGGWSYSISRLSSPAQSNTHIVRVTSGNAPGHEISIDVWTRAVQRGEHVRATVLYARVLYRGLPVVNTTVVCSTGSGYSLQLLDTGAGDPDTGLGDGVYSRYLQYLLPGEHSLSCTVYGQHSFVQDRLGGEEGVTRLDQFTRTMCCVPVSLTAAEVSVSAPPARILDLSVSVVTSSQQLQLAWTASGDDYDWGKLASYQLFTSPDPQTYTRPLASNLTSRGHQNSAVLVQSFSAGQQAGHREHHIVRINMFDQEMFYVLVPVDSEGNIGEMSNIVSAYMPRPQLIGGDATNGNTPLREGLFDPMRRPTEPNLVIMYVIVGIVCIVIFTFIVIVTVIVVIRNKTSCDSRASPSGPGQSQSNTMISASHSKDSFSDYKISMGGDTQDCLDIFNHLPSTAETNTYVKGYQTSPTYAKPVPKSMRKTKNDQNKQILNQNSSEKKNVIIREEGDGEEEYSHYKDNYAEYARISTLKKVPPPTLPKPSQHCKPDILSNYANYNNVRNITTV